LRDASADLTNHAARFFCRKFIVGQDEIEKRMLLGAVARMLGILAGKPALSEEPVAVKIPEGYTFYALFPEQYLITASNWAQRHPGTKNALVVGVRSIGISFSAVVTETLRLVGWTAARITVRASGHFERPVVVKTLKHSPVTTL
jgi:hypothetical protein